MPTLHINTIQLRTFKAVLARYPAQVPDKLQDLDELRYDTIPTKFAKRVDTDPELAANEVEKLVEWKLKHGTFRPKLLSLVQSNSAELVTKSTKDGFEVLADESADGAAFEASVLKAVKIVTQLKGIGPATASLLLSVMRPDEVPFFSDELFRWCTWDSPGSPNGWKRSIKYNVKEYAEVLRHVRESRERLGNEVRAVDVERVAWVLGKEGADVDAEEESEEEERAVKKGKEEQPVAEESAPSKSEKKGKASKKESGEPKRGTKRNASDVKPPTEGVRKSSRTKK